MTVMKWFGGAILLGAALVLRLMLARYASARLRVLDAYIALLTYLRGQVDGYALSERECLMRADRDLLAACAGQRERAPTVVKLRTLVQISRPFLGRDAERILTGFAGEFGSCYREEQIRRCEERIAALRAVRAHTAAALPQQMRQAGLLALCGALGAILLLW